MRRGLLLATALSAVMWTSSAGAQVPVGTLSDAAEPRLIQTSVGSVMLVCAEPPTDVEYEQRCEVAEGAGCVSKAYEYTRTLSSCGVQVGSVGAACSDEGRASSGLGPGSASWWQGCSATAGDSTVRAGCGSQRGYGGGASSTDDTCGAGPVSVHEHYFSDYSSSDDTNELTIQVGDATVACADDDGPGGSYEVDECAAR
jgi:hypothetical protein